MKGIGKTELLKQLCARSRELAVDQTFYFNFNGGGQVATIFMKHIQNRISIDVFGSLLLYLCGVPLEIAQQLDISKAMVEFRKILKLQDGQTLLICVDEIGELGEDIGKELLSQLMRLMDDKRGELIFVFTHTLDSFLQKLSSGRKVIIIPLGLLSIDIWKKIPQLEQASKRNPPCHQLLLSCCGHPRAIFDGIFVACENNPTLLSDSNEAAIAVARSKIIEYCKFRDVRDIFIEENLERWFSRKIGRETRDILKDYGLLMNIQSSTEESTEVFFPLLVQDWANRNSKNSELAYHLQQVYAADATLGLDSEKKMEAVMYHYEAVLRTCLDDRPFKISTFYGGCFCGILLPKLQLIRPELGLSEHLVKMVDNFSDTEELIDQLNSGFILVSRKHSEEGIEYLVPFKNTKDDSLVVGAVQCKYVTTRTNWKTIKLKLQNGTKNLNEEGIQTFPIVFSTVDQSYLKSKTYKGGLYFTEEGIFKFTNRLGVLRLHTQKLGKALSKQYPILERASSNIIEALDMPINIPTITNSNTTQPTPVVDTPVTTNMDKLGTTVETRKRKLDVEGENTKMKKMKTVETTKQLQKGKKNRKGKKKQ
eukprot:TRINITY_DN4043_c0_g1_i5.p1 TRINITY_DN4043_c0_g1~~TRINITY_DN4043_c0_g1_i5.p1  ORF type:complete len:653 (-),score=114.49 TRINITY_DN4043_c0_g1_i5:14-1795(-)